MSDLQYEDWTFIEGRPERNEMTRIVSKNDRDFIVGYVLCEAVNESARSEDMARAKLIADAPVLLQALSESLAYVQDAVALGGYKKGVVEKHEKHILELLKKHGVH